MEYVRNALPFLLATVLASSAVEAQDTTPCPSVAEGQYPALVFVVSARALRVDQLNNTLFLAITKDNTGSGAVYAIDLNAGVMTRLPLSTRIRLLRAVPEQKKAMLMVIDEDMSEIKLIELDLATLEVAVRHTLAGRLFARARQDKPDRTIESHVRLSPDFTRLVFASPQDDGTNTHALRLLDLSTKNTVDLDVDLRLELSPISSFSTDYARPPVEWITNHEIIYQHIPSQATSKKPGLKTGQGPNERLAFGRLHEMRIANVDTRRVSQCVRQKLPLTLGGGTMQRHPLTGEIVYQDEWIVDVRRKRLTPRNDPFSVVKRHPADKNGQTVVRDKEKELFRGKRLYLDDCISPSHKHFAYALRHRLPTAEARESAARRGDWHVDLYAKAEGMDDPVKVVGGSYRQITPVAWIEDVNDLRPLEGKSRGEPL